MSSPKTPAFPQALDPRFRSPARPGIVSRLPLPPPLDGKTPRPRVAVGTDVPIESDRVPGRPGDARRGVAARGGRPTARETVPDAPAARAAQRAEAGRVAADRNRARARAVRRPPSLWSLVGAALLGFGVAFAAVYAFRYAAGLGPSAVTDAVVRSAQSVIDPRDPGEPGADANAGAASKRLPAAAVPARAMAHAARAEEASAGNADGRVAAATRTGAGEEHTNKDATERPDALAADANVDDGAEPDGVAEADATEHAAVPDTYDDTAAALDDAAEPFAREDEDEGASAEAEADPDEDDAETKSATVADEPEDVAARRRRDRASGKRRRRARAAADAPKRRQAERPTKPAPASGEPAYLTIDAAPYATIYVDGERLGDTPLVGVSIRAGKRRVRAVSASGASKTFSIDIEPGDTFRRRMTFD